MSETSSLGSVEVSLSPLARFEEYLQSRGKRMTRPQRLLIEHVFSRHDHFDADSLLDQLPQRGDVGRIGRATVYRTLTKFVEAGLLRSFILDGRTVYEHDYGYPQHDHLHCTECQQLIEFQSSDLLKLRDLVAQDYRFKVTGHRLIITGVCEACQKSRQRTKRRVDLI
ncbi:MAG: Fur family transcriptional regulator [Planctomycetota bacterium]